MDDRRVAEYFVVAGLPSKQSLLEDFTCDGATLKSTHSLPPITDIGVVNRTLAEVVPEGYTCVETTVGGYPANLNNGVLRSQEMFLCYRRGRDKPPLFDIGVLFEGRERLLPDSQVVEFTTANHSANINPNGNPAYITYRRATEETAYSELVVSDICIIMTNKGEIAPHSYCTIERNLNKGNMVGSDIFLCYRKSINRAKYIPYKAGVLDQYPLRARNSFPLPDDLALFCLPMGAILEAWPPQTKMPQPVFSTFVLTIAATTNNTANMDSAGEGIEKVYGSAVSFYEPYPHEKLTSEQIKILGLEDHFGCRNIIHTNKSICILSMWPFFYTFKKFLMYLYELLNTAANKIPIERYIWHLLECVPFPSPRRPCIFIELDSMNGISLAQLEDSPLPVSGASFRKLLMTLRPEGCLQVLLFALTEQKLLLHSLRPHVLTAVAEAITMMIFPFHWQCPYIPLCPLSLSNILNAPIPFLLGLDSRFFDLYDPPKDVICIDLDTAAISVPEDKRHLTLKLLPKKYSKMLRNSLDLLCGSIKSFDLAYRTHKQKTINILDQNIDSDFKLIRKKHELECAIQEAFLRFTASILKGYSQFLLPIVSLNSVAAPDTASLFNIDDFVKSKDRYNLFYNYLVGTQMFSKFIEERSFVSDKNASLVFFDECIEKLSDDNPNTRLFEREPAASETSFFLPGPEAPASASVDGYDYAVFPKLNHELFPKKVNPFEVESAKGLALGSPGSPLARRSKHEVRSAQKLAYKFYQIPIKWAKCLLYSSFSVWFAQLPSFISVVPHKRRVLEKSFLILKRMQKLSLLHQDEVCYRVMMQLCGVYNKPALAVKILCEMKNSGITPNAITYGYYNRAVLESKWTHSNLMWNKLRNVVIGVRAFRQSGFERAQRRRSSSLSIDELDYGDDLKSSSGFHEENTIPLQPPKEENAKDQSEDCIDRTSPYSSETCLHDVKRELDFSESDEFRQKWGSIIRSSKAGLSSGVQLSLLETHPLLSSKAGLLMTSPLDASYFDPKVPKQDRPTDLAEALSSTLAKYDQIHVPSLLPTFDSHSSNKETPEFLRSNSYGKDDKILRNHLCLIQSPEQESTVISNNKHDEGLPETLSCSPKNSVISLSKSKDSKSSPNPRDIIKGHDDDSITSGQTLNDDEPEVTTTFFSRNTSARLSSLWKKGIETADGRIRDLWRRGNRVTKDSSKLASLKNADKISVESADNASIESGDKEDSPLEFDSEISSSWLDEKEQTEGSQNEIPHAIEPICPVVSPSKDGNRQLVLAGDPLGALNVDSNIPTMHDITVSHKSFSLPRDSLCPEQVKDFNSSKKFGKFSRSSTLPSCDIHQKAECPTNSRWTLKPPFSKKNSDSLPSDDKELFSHETQIETLKKDNFLNAWVSPFKIPLSSNTTFGIATSVASQGIRQASELGRQIGTLTSSFIDPTLAEWVSPATFNARKGELLSGGISSMKSAVTSISKKYTELRDAIISTPSRSTLKPEDGDDEIDAFWNFKKSFDAGLFSADGDGGDMDHTHMDVNNSQKNLHIFCLGIWITSCSKCHNCKGLLFDEEIMAGWSPDDSNLNTKCWHCHQMTVPLLTVTLYDLRHLSKDSVKKLSDQFQKNNVTLSNPPLPSSAGAVIKLIEDHGMKLEPLTVPYLSPLVLRKELETILGHDGDTCLIEPKFCDHHPILYWNMMWYFGRLKLPSHLSGLLLTNLPALKDRQVDESWQVVDWRNVYVRCLWDNPYFHQELGFPLYTQWNQNECPSPLVDALTPHGSTVSKDVLQSFLTLLHYNKINRCLELMVQLLKKAPVDVKSIHFPLYRDLFFLAYRAIPSDSLDISYFEREFRKEFEKIQLTEKMVKVSDGPPSVTAIFCRKYFKGLEL